MNLHNAKPKSTFATLFSPLVLWFLSAWLRKAAQIGRFSTFSFFVVLNKLKFKFSNLLQSPVLKGGKRQIFELDNGSPLSMI